MNTIYAMRRSFIAFGSYLSEYRIGNKGVLLNIDAGSAGEGEEELLALGLLMEKDSVRGRKVGKDILVVVNRKLSFLYRMIRMTYCLSRFLWKFTQGNLQVYNTTGRNNYVALCEPDYISFGGG